VDLEASKRVLRRRAAARRREALAEAGGSVAIRICEHLMAEAAIVNAERLALYAALPDEVPTRPLFDALAATGKTLMLPRIASAGSLVFAVVERFDELISGEYGVLAPPPDAPAAIPAAGDVVVVPGVAFDAHGRRLGRGAGCYDRTFPADQESSPLLVGMACEAQIFESVPCGSHDRAMDAIVTERGFRWVKGGR
jgi:5-formyltetrahydrofolate cyclo-ligase